MHSKAILTTLLTPPLYKPYQSAKSLSEVIHNTKPFFFFLVCTFLSHTDQHKGLYLLFQKSLDLGRKIYILSHCLYFDFLTAAFMFPLLWFWLSVYQRQLNKWRRKIKHHHIHPVEGICAAGFMGTSGQHHFTFWLVLCFNFYLGPAAPEDSGPVRFPDVIYFP